jgi:hypothetical protein
VAQIAIDANSAHEPKLARNATNRTMIGQSTGRSPVTTINETDKNPGTFHPSCASENRNKSSRRVFNSVYSLASALDTDHERCRQWLEALIHHTDVVHLFRFRSKRRMDL